VKQLLCNNKEINLDSENPSWKKTSFWIACRNGHIEIVKLLLNEERIDINKGKYSRTPFELACSLGHTGIVKLLLNDKRIDVNIQDKLFDQEKTAFYLACENGRTEVVKLLFEDQRIDVYQPDNVGCTPLYIACQKGHVDIVKFLLKDKMYKTNNDNHLQTACVYGRFEVVKWILAIQTDLNIRWEEDDDDGRTLIRSVLDGLEEECDEYSDDEDCDAFMERAKNYGGTVGLLKAFQIYPNEVRNKLKIELGLTGNIYIYFISFLFTLLFCYFQ